MNKFFKQILIIILACYISLSFINDVKGSDDKSRGNIVLCEPQGISFDEIAEIVLNKKLNLCDLIDFSQSDLRLLRNTIYAKHGRVNLSPKYRGKKGLYKVYRQAC